MSTHPPETAVSGEAPVHSLMRRRPQTGAVKMRVAGPCAIAASAAPPSQRSFGGITHTNWQFCL